MTPIESFRILTKALREMAPDDDLNIHLLDTPPDVKELFQQFVKEASAEDLVDCLCILSNTGAHDWDIIAHMFL